MGAAGFRVATGVGVVLAFPSVLNHSQSTRLLTCRTAASCAPDFWVNLSLFLILDPHAGIARGRDFVFHARLACDLALRLTGCFRFRENGRRHHASRDKGALHLDHRRKVVEKQIDLVKPLLTRAAGATLSRQLITAPHTKP
jgi:hypothetical protein